ncbi:MAG: hypothetical protein LBD86_01985, partial [Spirochaetaceae bacterium]|nr:hypothetical protein [Spirochaetaceae bacterium]
MKGYKDFLCMEASKAGFSRVRVLSPFEPGSFFTRGLTLSENYRSGAKSLLVCALPYGNRHAVTVPHSVAEIVPGVIAPFARFNYYREAVKRMKRLSILARARYGGKKSDYRILCNSPVPEKPLAVACGLGVRGRNSMVICHESGSLFVIAAMTLPYPLETDPALKAPLPTDWYAVESCPQFPLCGNCGHGPSETLPCVRACPTGAMLGNGRVNLEKCIQWYASGHGAP